jgi:hypothetical protein
MCHAASSTHPRTQRPPPTHTQGPFSDLVSRTVKVGGLPDPLTSKDALEQALGMGPLEVCVYLLVCVCVCLCAKRMCIGGLCASTVRLFFSPWVLNAEPLAP